MAISSIKKWYGSHEKHVSTLALVGGFILDNLTLRRVDLWAENIYIIVLLAVLGLCIGLINILERRRRPEQVPGRAHFWLLIIIQFAVGGLFSVFFVFYSRSTTFAASWPFLLLLAVAMIGNEVLRKHYLRLSFQISVFFVAVYSFAIFAVPLVFRKIGPVMFLLSTLASILILAIFIAFLKVVTRENFKESKKILAFSIGGIVLVLNILYFTNLIPPIPLALKDGGAYHLVEKSGVGGYTVSGEKKVWTDYFKSYQPIHSAGGPVYVFSAVFSPTDLNTAIIHHWQYYDEKKKEWVDYGNIKLSIVGGRDGGFRTYSVVFKPKAGKWRVDVETERGQVIGRIPFEVISVKEEPTLVTKIK